MAKTISDEVMKFSLEINGSPAQKELSKLTSTNSDLKKVLKELNAEEVQRKRSLAKLTEEYGRNAKIAGECEIQSKKLHATYKIEEAKLESLASQYGKNSVQYKTQKRNVDSLLNSSEKLEINFEKLTDKNIKLSPTIDKLSSEYKTLKDRIKGLNVDIDSNAAKIDNYQKEIGITALSMDQLRKKAAALSLVLNHLVPNTSDHIKYSAELNEVKSRIGELTSKSITAKSSISSLADGFNKYAALGTTVVAALTGVVLSVQKIIDINGKLSDAQADVIKTTGLTKIEVDELTKSFGLLQTRTSRIDLLGIAEQGGRIGIAKAEIGDFVKTMNMAAVSLGDSFTGGAEEVATKLGKIKFLFEETKGMNVEQAYNSIGSAINDLGANGVASEANIADFTTRIGSLTDVLKPSIQEVLALGTAFEESGIESEVSARAYGIFMKQASTETGKFAQVMGISQQAVKDMINTNPMEFMLKFSEGMKGMSATDTATTLDALGISADGANKVIGAMGNNTARFRELIDLSNNSFASGTSLINEYTIKNETLGATLEKISKRISGMFSSETFIKYLGTAVSWFAVFIGATEESEQKVSGLRTGLAFTVKILGILIASLIGYSAATRIAALDTKSFGVASAWANVQSKLEVMWTTLKIAGLTIYTGVMNFFGITTDKATASLVAMNLASKATPWGAIIGLIVAAGAAYLAFRDSVNKTSVEIDSFAKQQKTLADEIGKSTAQTKAHLGSLVTVIDDTNVSLDTRKKAYAELIKIAPEFNGLIIKEGEKVNGLITIYDDYIKALDKVAYARGMAKLNEKNIEKEINDSQKLFNAEKRLSTAKKAFDEYQKNSVLGGSIKRDNKLYSDMMQEVGLSQVAFDAAKSNLSNTKKIVTETNKFKISELKTIDKSISANEKELSSLEKLYGKEIALKSSRGKQLTMILAADKKAKEAMIGVTSTDPNAKSNFNVPDSGAGAGNGKASSTKAEKEKKQEDENKKLLESADKLNQERIKNQREAEDDRLASLPEGYTKENALEQANFDRKITDLKAQLIKEEDIKQAFAQASNPKLSESERTFWKAQAEKWKSDNEANNSKIESAQKLHKTKMGVIEEKAAKVLLDDELKTFEQAKINRETAFNNQLAGENLSEDQKKNRRDVFNLKEIEIQKEFLKKKIEELKKIMSGQVINGIDFSLLSPEAKEEIKKNVELVENALSKMDAAKPDTTGKKELDLGIGGKDKDVLGFSVKQWDDFFTNIKNGTIGVQTMTMALMVATEVFSKMDQFMSASENASLKKSEKNANTKKASLKKQLDSGVLSQTQYNKKIEKIDADLDKEKLQVEIKQAKRQRILTMLSIVSNTAAAIMGIWKDVPKFDYGTTAFALSVMVGTLGALQLATVAKQPMPGHEQGLYPDYVTREQDGKKFKSSYGGETRSGLVSKTSHFLVAENGPEMVIDAKAWRQMNPEVKDALVRDLRGVKGYEKGLYQPEVTNPRNTTPANAPVTQDNQLLQSVLAVLQDNTDVMKQLKDEGVLAMVSNRDLKSMKNLKEGINDYDALRNKSKK